MKQFYEYDVVDTKDGYSFGEAYTREEARELLREVKAEGLQAKIMQSKYVLAEKRVVR